MLTYSASMNMANFSDEYSVWETADQLALGLGQVERGAVGLADHRGDVHRERNDGNRRTTYQVFSWAATIPTSPWCPRIQNTAANDSAIAIIGR